MTETTNDTERRTVLRRISDINSKIKQEKDFIEFGASTDLDYQMTHARIAALKTEKSELKEILSDV